MIIGIDGNEANVERKVGIGEYAFELLLKFKEFSISNSEFSKVVFRIYLKNPPRPEMPQESENWKYIIVGPKKLWTQIGLPLYLFTHFPRPDIFFTPTHYGPRWSPVPTVISVMDLSYIHFPELFAKKDLYQLKNWTSYSVKNASKIFTISQASKDDIIKEYRIDSKKIIVTYPGIKENMEEKISNIKELEEKFGIKGNYILFVGTLQPRKNIERLIEAFSLIVKGDSGQARMTNGLQLVVVGKKGWLYEPILEAPKKFGVEESVKFLNFVEDKDLPSLYKNALCYVLPSLYEGFGLPVVEAMKYGCPVVTSNVSSLPEAGGDAALYFDPLDTQDIAEKIEKVIESPKLREEMVKKGYNHIKMFSWKKAAKETLDVLQQIAKQTKN
ncbi:MAG TPA: glycosyltransferase family 1 protein [Patescibacteria group bacterium]